MPLIEIIRKRNIERNKLLFESLGLNQPLIAPRSPKKARVSKAPAAVAHRAPTRGSRSAATSALTEYDIGFDFGYAHALMALQVAVPLTLTLTLILALTLALDLDHHPHPHQLMQRYDVDDLLSACFGKAMAKQLYLAYFVSAEGGGSCNGAAGGSNGSGAGSSNGSGAGSSNGNGAGSSNGSGAGSSNGSGAGSSNGSGAGSSSGGAGTWSGAGSSGGGAGSHRADQPFPLVVFARVGIHALGFVLLRLHTHQMRNRQLMEVPLIAVSPEAKGCGIAEALLGYAELIAAQCQFGEEPKLIALWDGTAANECESPWQRLPARSLLAAGAHVIAVAGLTAPPHLSGARLLVQTEVGTCSQLEQLTAAAVCALVEANPAATIEAKSEAKAAQEVNVRGGGNSLAEYSLSALLPLLAHSSYL